MVDYVVKAFDRSSATSLVSISRQFPAPILGQSVDLDIAKLEYAISLVESLCAQFDINVDWPTRDRMLVVERTVVSSDVNGEFEIRSLLDSLRSTWENRVSYRRRLLHVSNVKPESEEVGYMQDTIVDSNVVVNRQNLVDIGGAETGLVDSGVSTYEDAGVSTPTPLSTYLERPVLIDTFSPAFSSHFLNTYNVYSLISSEPAIRAKMRNYAFFRADLRIRISVSGTPFHMGKIIFSWQPFRTSNGVIAGYNTAGLTSGKPYKSYLLQSKHSVVVDARENEPIEMVIPFFFNKPFLRLYNSFNGVINTAFYDFENIGQLICTPLNEIDYATSVAPPLLSVTIIANFENVQLSMNTATQVEILTESEEFDERKSGPIEKFASGALEVSKLVGQIPYLTKYALASQVPLRLLRHVSSHFGWSKPTVDVDKVLHVKNMGFQNGAQVVGYESCSKISLDPKQEVSLLPHIAGSEADELSLAYLTSREGYLTTFVWDSTYVPFVSNIWASYVTPVLCATQAGITKNVFQPTPLAFAAMPFAYWCGDIEFRFEIVCSAYHRGKLGIVFEPNIEQIGLLTNPTSTHKRFTKIIDIQETRSVQFCVKWASNLRWKRLTPIAEYVELYQHAANPVINDATQEEHCNGFIMVYPYTELQSPTSTGVQVNVYVSSNNCRFNLLTETNLPLNRAIGESGDGPATMYNDGFLSISQSQLVTTDDVSCMVLNPNSITWDRVSQDYFGEQPLSFRALLKRFTTNLSVGISSNALPNSFLWLYRPNYPAHNVFMNGSSSRTNLWDYMLYAYVGMRGTMRHRQRVSMNNPIYSLDVARVSLEGLATTSAAATSQFSYPSDAETIGTVNFAVNSNAGIEYEIPFYSNVLFLFPFSDTFVGVGGITPQAFQRRHVIDLHMAGAYDSGYVQTDSAIGEDFDFIRFNGGAPFRD